MISTHSTTSNTLSRAGGAILAVAALSIIAVPDLSAQRRGPVARAAIGTVAVEMPLRLAERLELTQEQRDQLEAVRVGRLEERAEHSAKMMNLASEIRAGSRERSAVREELAAIREEAEASRKALREQVAGILTDQQKEELRRVARRAAWRQVAVRGRPGMDRWRDGRGRPGLDRGRGGRAWGPMDRGRGGDRIRGWRRPAGSGA